MTAQALQKQRKHRRRSEALVAYSFLAPYMFVFFTFTVFAIGYTVYLSFTRYNLLRPPEWWGLEGWKRVLQDDLFLTKALPNTFKYVLIVVPVQTVISLILAFAMTLAQRARSGSHPMATYSPTRNLFHAYSFFPGTSEDRA